MVATSDIRFVVAEGGNIRRSFFSSFTGMGRSQEHSRCSPNLHLHPYKKKKNYLHPMPVCPFARIALTD